MNFCSYRWLVSRTYRQLRYNFAFFFENSWGVRSWIRSTRRYGWVSRKTEYHGRNKTGEIHDFWIATLEGREFLSRNGFWGLFLVALSVGDFLMKSRWVRIPMTLGNRVIWRCCEIQRFPVLFCKKRFWTIGDIIFTKWHIPFQNRKNHLPMYHKQYTESLKISQRQLLWRLESTKKWVLPSLSEI